MRIDERLEALAEHLSQIPKGISPTPIFSQMQILQDVKAQAKRELERILCSGEVTDFPASLKEYKSFCELIHEALLDQKNEDMRKCVIQAFVHKIEIFSDSYRLHYYVGQSHLKQFSEDKVKSKIAVGASKMAIEGPSAEAVGRESDFFWTFGSNRLTNGAENLGCFLMISLGGEADCGESCGKVAKISRKNKDLS